MSVEVAEDQVNCLIIAPLWPTQTWFTKLMKMLVHLPIIMKKTKDVLYLPHTGVKRPLSKALVMTACIVSGNLSQVRFSREATDILMSSWRFGTKKQYQTYIAMGSVLQ